MPYAVALDADVAIIAPVSAAALHEAMDAWFGRKLVLAIEDRRVTHLGGATHCSYLVADWPGRAALTSARWFWYSDAPAYERHTFGGYWRALKPFDAWTQWDHSEYLCYLMREDQWAVEDVSPIARALVAAGDATAARVLETNDVVCCWLEGASLALQRAIEKRLRYSFLWLPAQSAFDPRANGGVRHPMHWAAEQLRAGSLGARWLVSHTDKLLQKLSEGGRRCAWAHTNLSLIHI